MGKKRILLVYSSEIQSTVVAGTLRVAPIGLFFINGYLKKQGHETKIIHLDVTQFHDGSGDSKKYINRLREEITGFNPDYIGYSFRNLYHWGMLPRNVRKLIDYLSISLEKATIDLLRETTSAPIIGGGPAFTLASKLYMDYLGLDYGLVGEGEKALEELVVKLDEGKSVEEIPGLVHRRDDSLIINPHECIDDLDRMPKMDVGNMEDYRELYYENGGYANIQTKRGCGFGCIYCQYPLLEGRNYRTRDPKTIVEEISELKERFGVRHFFFVDSVFSTPAEHSRAVCEEIIARGVDIRWSAHMNPRGITRELLEIYKKSGCHNVIFTPDTLSKKVLTTYRKDFSLEDVERSVRLLKEVQIPFEVSLILGGPGEDETSVGESMDFADRHLRDVPVLIFNGMWIHSGAPVMETAISEGVLSEDTKPLSDIILTNDFAANKRRNYFFPHVKKDRGEFLKRIYSRIRKHKRIIADLDVKIDWKTGTVRHAPELGVLENQRPWHKGMKGRD